MARTSSTLSIPVETAARRVPTPFRVRSVDANVSQLAWAGPYPSVEESIGIKTIMTPKDLPPIERLAAPPGPTQSSPLPYKTRPPLPLLGRSLLQLAPSLGGQ